MRRVLVDTDCGIDDALALTFLVRATEVELTEITSTWGNCAAEEAAANARYVLGVGGANYVPVTSGSRPSPSWQRGDAHGADGLGDTEPPRRSGTEPEIARAAESIVRFAREHAGDAELLCIGPLTNLSAALRLEPRLPELVKHVVIMGGHGVSTSEWLRQVGDTNTRHDPAAAQHVASSSIPAVWIGIDVTRTVLLTEEDFGNGTVGRFLRRIHHDYGARRASTFGYDLDVGWRVPAHDGVAAACLASASSAGLVTMPGRLSVVDTIDSGPVLQHVGSGPHRVATGVDPAAVRAMLRRGTQ